MTKKVRGKAELDPTKGPPRPKRKTTRHNGNNRKPCKVNKKGVKLKKDGTPRKGNNRPKKIGHYKTYTYLIDTRGNCGFDYGMYADECAEQGINPQPEDSSAFILWINTKRAKAIDGFFDRITWCHKLSPAILTGSIEFWDGRKPIKPMWFEGDGFCTFPSGFKGYRENAIKRAVIKCVRGMDDFRAWMEYGGIALECFHRDGVNRFLIRNVSWLGESVHRNMAENGKDMMELAPKRYWFTNILRKELELDRKGKPMVNPTFVSKDTERIPAGSSYAKRIAEIW